MHGYIITLLLALGASAHAAVSSLQVDVTVTVHAISISWDAASTGGAGTTNKTWALGNVIGGQVLKTDSGAAAANFTVLNGSGAAVALSIACAANSTGGANPWSKAAAAGVDQFKMETGTYLAGSGDANYGLDLSTGNLAIPSLADAGTWRFNLRFTAPTSSTDATAKSIAVTVTAAAP